MAGSRDSWSDVVRAKRPGVHRKIQQIMSELQRAGWERETLAHLARVFYEFAGKYHQSSVQRFNAPSDLIWEEIEALLGNMGWFLSRVDIQSYPRDHRTWIKNVLKSVRIPASPPVAAWYLQNLVEVLVDPVLAELHILRDGVLKSVRRNNLDAFHKLNILLNHSSAKDLVALEDQAQELLRESGRRAFPKDKVGSLVQELVVRHAIYRLARIIDDVDPRDHQSHVDVLNRLFGIKGASFHPEEARKLPLITLAGALAVERVQLGRRQVDPRYFLFLKALTARRVHKFAESLLKDAPAWVRLIDCFVVPPSASNVKIILSKKDLVSQAQALERFPTCHTPLYGEHADKILFTPYASGVVPVVAVAKDLQSGRVVGRLNILFDENTGNVYITSLPFGKVGLDQYLEAVELVARRINKELGQKKFKQILVGDLSKNSKRWRLSWGIHDTYIKREEGGKKGYYFTGRVVRRVE